MPVGALYTPLKEIENLALVQYEPVKCQNCETVLNPFCMVDFRYKTWMCTSCNTKNQFKSHYASNISEQQLPAELIRDFPTIEYILPPAVPATQ